MDAIHFVFLVILAGSFLLAGIVIAEHTRSARFYVSCMNACSTPSEMHNVHASIKENDTTFAVSIFGIVGLVVASGLLLTQLAPL